MSPQFSKKGIGTLRQTTGQYASHVFVPNYSNTSFVNKFQHLYSMAFNKNTHAKASFWLQLMHLFKNLKARQKTDVVVLDFSKAFDVVPHERRKISSKMCHPKL